MEETEFYLFTPEFRHTFPAMPGWQCFHLKKPN